MGRRGSSGPAKFAADYGSQETLVGRILRSPVAHADIARIGTSRAEQLIGVRAIVTGADVAASYAVLPIAMNEYAVAKARVRYRGEPVAAVAAIDVETAVRALDLIEVEYQGLPAYFSATADLVREEIYRISEVCQVQSEPHATFAEYDAERGRLTGPAKHTGALLRASDAGADHG